VCDFASDEVSLEWFLVNLEIVELPVLTVNLGRIAAVLVTNEGTLLLSGRDRCCDEGLIGGLIIVPLLL